MAVTVHVPGPHGADRDTDVFAEADGWHVDDERQLHVKKSGGGNLASYSVNAWLSVRDDN